MSKKKNILDLKMKLSAFAAILSIYNLIAYHVPFFRYVSENVDSTASSETFIIISLAIVLLLLNYFACYLLVFLLRGAGKVIVATANLLSAASVYFIQVYKVIIDDSMMGNVFNTNYSEASGFFCFSLVAFIVLFGLLPSFWIIRQRVNYLSWKQFGLSSGVSLSIVVAGILLNTGNFLWIGKHDTELGGLLMPWSYTVNTGRLLSQKKAANREEIRIADAVKLPSGEKKLVVLVIGESARKCNFSLYGYKRNTNPLLSLREGVTALDAHSCATYTTAAVKAILEPVDSDDLYEILPNYARRCGADVLWRSSNWGEPPVHVEHNENLDYIRANCSGMVGNMQAEDLEYDGALLFGLKERIDSCKNDRMLVVIHSSTSHGPCYSKRYPSRFGQFTPVSDNVEQAEKDLDGLVNAYDNTILYTDYLLDRIIDILSSLETWSSVMMYVSDHGESLGEDQLFMHGLPMAVAPATQYEIPFLVWSTPGAVSLKDSLGTIDQHYVFHSAMTALGYEGEAIDRQKSVFK